MGVQQRNNVNVVGEGPATLVFAHGFGCDKHMWRLLAPRYAARWRTVLFDHVGSGASDLAAYDRVKYASLHGYADDVREVIEPSRRDRWSSSGIRSAPPSACWRASRRPGGSRRMS